MGLAGNAVCAEQTDDSAMAQITPEKIPDVKVFKMFLAFFSNSGLKPGSFLELLNSRTMHSRKHNAQDSPAN